MKIGMLIPLIFVAAASWAQMPTRPGSITAVGEASISVVPDRALVAVAVNTQAATALDATQQNATLATTVITALQNLLGANATIKTTGYSVSPVYNNPPAGQNASIIGYSVTNTLQVTLTDLTQVGKAIDTAIQSGANRVQGVSFTLQDNTAAVAQVLKTAATRARSQADAIASGLNVHTGAVIHASQGTNVVPTPTTLVPVAAGATTPIETGMVVVQAAVTLEVAITP